MFSIMCFRVFFLGRTFFNFTMYTDSYAKKLCQSYGFDAGYRFAFKCLLATNPSLIVFSLTGLVVVSEAYQMRIYERPYY